MGQQYQQYLERLAGQPNAQAAPAQLSRGGVHLKRPECRAKGLGLIRYAASDTGQSLLSARRDVDVIA
jgi:hypothetical protein